MSTNVSANTPEIIENIDSINLKPDISKLSIAQEQFVNERVKKDPDLLKKISSNGDFEALFRSFLQANFPDLARELKEVALKEGSSDEDKKKLASRNSDVEKIWKTSAIEPIRIKAIEHTVALQGKRDRIIRDLQQFLDIKKEESKIKDHLDTLHLNELEAAHKTILESPKSRKIFLEKIDKVNMRNIFNIRNIEKTEVENATKEQILRQKFYKKLANASKHLSSEDLYRFIDTNVPDPTEKEELLRQFVPKIPLTTLLKLGMPDVEQEAFRQEVIRKAMEKERIQVPNGFEPDTTFLENIMVSTDKNTLAELTAGKLDSIVTIVGRETSLLKTQAHAIQEYLEKEEHEKLGDLSELNLTPEGPNEDIHDEFVRKAIDKTGNTSLDNLQEKGYIEFTVPGENNAPIKQYFKILKVNLGTTLETKSLKVINLTGPDGYLDVEPKDENSASATPLSYIELYSLLKHNPYSVKCFNNKEFERHKEAAQLKELPSMDTDGEITDEVLRNFLELNDPEGVKYGLDQGTCFTFESGAGENKGTGTCRILGIDPYKEGKDRKIKLTNTNAKNSEMSLRDFFAAFTTMKAKRIAKFSDTPNMLAFLQQEAHDDVKKGFKEATFKDGKLLESDKSDAPEIKHLLGESDKIIEIHKWNGDQVQITTGKLEEKDKTSKNGVDSVKREIKPEHKPAWVGIEELYQQIAKIKAKPFKQPKNEIPTGKTDSTPLKRKFSFGGMVEAGLSFAQIMGTVKLAKDPIFNFFKRNDEEHSAELALKLYGRFMPEEIRKNFEKKIDKARADSVSKFKDMITGWPHVKKILEKSNVERFELEAAMLYTMEKAGTLYPEKLAPLQFSGGNPTYAWYRALGGAPNDALFMSIKRECETNKNPQGEPDPIPFTEERLVEKLLKTQGSDIKDFKDATKDRAKYGIKYKCRGGVEKEFAIAKAKGIKEGVEDGEKKLSDEVTTAGKLKTIISALKDSKYAAAFGGLSKLLESNGKREEMYKATILIALSGVGTTLDKEVTAKLPGFAKYPYPPLLFMTSPGDVKLFQNTCLALTGGDTDLSAALKETDMKKKIEKLEEYLNKDDNNKKLAESLTGNDKEHVIFTEKDGNKSHSNTYYQFYAKVSDKVKEHKASQEGMEKRVYTKKHSAMIWFDQSAEYIGGLRLNPQTTDLDDGETNNKKFKDALEAYEDLLKAIKGAKSENEKKVYYSRFKYLFERLYIPARRVINRNKPQGRAELAFTDRMAKAGIDLMATSSEGWTPTKFDIKNAEFQDFLESQWRKLLDGKTIQSEANKNIENTKLDVDKIISLGRKNTAFQKRIKRTLDQEDEWDFAA